MPPETGFAGLEQITTWRGYKSDFVTNSIFSRIEVFAYDLFVLFTLSCLPITMQHYQVQTPLTPIPNRWKN